MARLIKVAAVQVAAPVGENSANLERAAEQIRDVAAQGAQIACLPELFGCGYFALKGECDARWFALAEPADGPTVSAMSGLARELGIYIIAPFFEKTSLNAYHNSAALLGPAGELVGVYRKTHIPWSASAWEKFYFRPGYDYPVFATDLGRVGILICRDRVFPEVARSLALSGAELICVPSATAGGSSPDVTSLDSWTFTLRTRALENELFVCGVGLAGPTGLPGVDFQGDSLVAGPQGELLGQIGHDPANLVCAIDLDRVEFTRQRRHVFRDRRPETYGRLVDKI